MLGQEQEHDGRQQQQQQNEQVYNVEEHLQRLCNAVGGRSVRGEYEAGGECIECLRDIKKLLRWSDATADKHLLLSLGQWRFIEQDLLPLLQLPIQGQGQKKLRTAVVELLVPLTWPVTVRTGDGDVASVQYAVEQRKHLLEYKRQITMNDTVLNLLIAGQLLDALERIAQSTQASGTVKQRDVDEMVMVLLLVRNLLLIKDQDTELLRDQELHDKLLAKLQECHFMTIVQTMVSEMITNGQQQDESQCSRFWDLHLLSVIHALVCTRNYSPDSFFGDAAGVDATFRTTVAQKQSKMISGGRPPSFKGSFVVRVNNGRHIVQDPRPQSMLALMDRGKKGKRQVVSAKKTVAAPVAVRRQCTATEQRVVGGGFMHEMLQGSFNIMSRVIRRIIVRERQDLRDEDVARYFQYVTFTLEYLCAMLTRDHDAKFDFGCVADVLNVPFVLLVIKLVTQYVDAKQVDAVCGVLKCFRQLMLTIDLMSQSPDSTDCDVSDSVLANLFTRMDHVREVIKCLTHPQWPGDIMFLQAAMSANHQLLKVMDRYRTTQDIVVVKKVRSSKQDGGEQRIKELPFDFEHFFAKEYCTESVAGVLVTMLHHHAALHADALRHCAVMISRVVQQHHCDLFMRLDMITRLEQILRDRNELMRRRSEYKDVVAVARLCINYLVEQSRQDPMLFVRLLMPYVRHRQQSDQLRDIAMQQEVAVPSKAKNKQQQSRHKHSDGYYSDTNSAMVAGVNQDQYEDDFVVIGSSDVSDALLADDDDEVVLDDDLALNDDMIVGGEQVLLTAGDEPQAAVAAAAVSRTRMIITSEDEDEDEVEL